MQLGEASLFGEYGPRSKTSDDVCTPDWCAADMVRYFQPSGRILEPCAGNGVFLNHLPPADWCEIKEGKDFFAWRDQVDWIMTNPPYSIVRMFLRHAISIATNIVFLMPPRIIFGTYGTIRECAGWGGMAALRWYGTGRTLNFPLGNSVAAIHWKRGHQGIICETFYEDEARCLEIETGI